MELVWSPHALIGIPPIVIGWALAWTIYRAGPGKAVNRRLALLLIAESSLVGIAQGLGDLLADAPSRYGFFAVFLGLGMALFPLFLLFLATIPTPLTRPLRSRTAEIVLWALVPILFLLPALATDLFVIAPDGFPQEDPRFSRAFLNWLSVLFVFSFAVALMGYLREPRGSIARRRAGAYAIAFGVHDLGWVLIFTVLLPFVWPNVPPSTLVVLHPLVYAANEVLFISLLAYGILKTQLLDIDLKIKWTIRRGTVVAILAAAFVMVAEVAQNWLSDAYGYLVGGLAAGALLLAVRPLDRAGQRVADAAMPRVAQTPAYLAYRKIEVYRAALEGAMQDGEVTHKEREMLRRLRESLALPEEDARALEGDLATRAG